MPATSAKIIGDGKCIIDLGDDARAGKVKRIELSFEGEDKVSVEEFIIKQTEPVIPPTEPEKPKNRFLRSPK